MRGVPTPAGEHRMVPAADLFGFESDLEVPVLLEDEDHVPARDDAYRFDPDVTTAVLMGFLHDRRVLVQGLHGTGKSTHIEQVAARLNWPCVRVNLDGDLTRLDLVGRDAVVVRDGMQVTEFQDGILPWALRRPVALVLDEYDAGPPEVMFVIHRMLEREGRLTLMDQSRVIAPHPGFRIFATANTIGLGNVNGLYHGVQRLNHSQLDRWNLTVNLDYLAPEDEARIVLAQVPQLDDERGRVLVAQMVAVAGLTRHGFRVGDITTLMSPRTVIHWAENHVLFDDVALAFRLTFLNNCDESERPVVAEYLQRCLDVEPERVLVG